MGAQREMSGLCALGAATVSSDLCHRRPCFGSSFMASPNDRRYLPTHEWHKPEGDLVVIGLSQFAVDELTDVTFLDITKKSGTIRKGDSFGEIESVKATSSLYSGIDGTIVEINQEALGTPALINQDPYARGWLIKVRPADPAQLQALLSGEDYDRQHV
jgi:glycine cleavage system H protein